MFVKSVKYFDCDKHPSTDDFFAWNFEVSILNGSVRYCAEVAFAFGIPSLDTSSSPLRPYLYVRTLEIESVQLQVYVRSCVYIDARIFPCTQTRVWLLCATVSS